MLDFNFKLPYSYTSNLNSNFNSSPSGSLFQFKSLNQSLIDKSNADLANKGVSSNLLNTNSFNGSNLGTTLAGQGLSALGSRLGAFTQGAFGDDELGKISGELVGSAVGTTFSTMGNNLLKGVALNHGLGTDVASSVAGVATGLAGQYMGKGIRKAMGNTWGGKFLGQGVSSTMGSVGGAIAQNLIKGNGFKVGGSPIGIAGQIVGSALSAANGPSKEYGGKYGKITRGMDTAYDIVQTGLGFVPGWGQIAAGAMALNKGLSNVFGSTDGMTVQDAILGSAFMPAPVKWLNMAGARTTQNFNNQSWQNTERTDSFMQNAFGNLADVFDKARTEAGKTYGTFSRNAYNKAQANMTKANNAWDDILAMTDQNELQNIRSQAMTSINNQRYAQMIQGGFNPIYRGKQGMKIFNNATNHNMGMRLLSAAALIDNKQMILCGAVD